MPSNNMTKYLQTQTREQETLLGCTIVAAMLVYGMYCYATWPTLQFTPDSWSYFELAKTLAGETPYKFWTFRSYWSREYSAAFPFGYPSLLWVVHRILGQQPSMGIVLNCVFAGMTPWAAGLLTHKLYNRAYYGVLGGLLLLLSPDYLDEVFAARSIPVSIFLVLMGLGFLADTGGRYKVFLAGLFIGGAALVRFDQVALVGLAALYICFLRKNVSSVVWFLAGASLAVSPWIVFSFTHFGRFWASDNSWVAISAVPAFVLEYPARAEQTIFTHTLVWMQKCLVNSLRFLKHAGISLWEFISIPVMMIGYAFSLLFRREKPPSLPNITSCHLLILALLAMLPQILTGYFAHRYFLLLLFLLSIVLIHHLTTCLSQDSGALVIRIIVVSAVLAGTLSGLTCAVKSIKLRPSRTAGSNILDAQLLKLSEQHAHESNLLYMSHTIGDEAIARYGAVYNRRAAMLPTNWALLDEITRQKFMYEFGPVRFVELHLRR